jgi:hypothetical protein
MEVGLHGPIGLTVVFLLVVKQENKHELEHVITQVQQMVGLIVLVLILILKNVVLELVQFHPQLQQL